MNGLPDVQHLAAREGLRLITSAEIDSEVRRVTARRFPDFADDLIAMRAALASFTPVMSLGAITTEVCRDRVDNRVLETAALGHASTIVTGVRDPLVPGRDDDIIDVSGIDILTPAEWLASEEQGPTRA